LSDNLNRVWEKFNSERRAPLFARFPGLYRAYVVETNDPLQWHRVRFKCPELHDWDLETSDCPWADKAPWLGGKNAGSWAHPIIGDIVWISFEKQHPYGPIWIGFASPTRRAYYPLNSIYTRSPLPVNIDEDPLDSPPEDFMTDYLPKDYRPMSHGWQDRYGSSEINSSVGFFPTEHDTKPAQLGQDAVAKSSFEEGEKPKVNEPDRKYLARVSKYGTIEILSDVGYYWKKDSDLGEFEGDYDKDIEFERKRYFYMTKLLNENQPNSKEQDQRRYEIRTRAGHKFEMRDVGWAQKSGGVSGKEIVSNTKCRNEYGESRTLSEFARTDERWLKWRTKGGHLIQMMDAGFHPEEDNFYKKGLLEEVGAKQDGEEEDGWTGRDSRQLRFVSRWGIKLVLDDRGTDPREAETKEKPRGNGWFFKSRRSWTAEPSTPRGFGFEANDKDELDTSRWYSPKSKLVELNDLKDYMLICTDMNKEISREWMKLKENEFATSIGMTTDPEKDTHHMKLDKANGYIRLKTSGNRDNQRRPEPVPFPDGEVLLENQGLEARDGRVGEDGAWTELIDGDKRGIWLSKKYGVGIWRAKDGNDQYILISDQDNTIVIRNNADGPLQIYCGGNVEIISERNIALKAADQITLKAGTAINFEAGGAHAQLVPGAWNMDVSDNAPSHTGFLPQAFPGAGAQTDTGSSCTVFDPLPIIQEKREPNDRAKVGNGPFDEVNENIIKGE